MNTGENKGQTEEKTEKKEKSTLREAIGMVIYVAGLLLVAVLVVRYVGQRTQVDGRSMEPMLYNGDNLMVDKISYRFHEPERFDIIVFEYQHKENTYYIKRVIGLPGETVQIQDGKIYINGEILDEDYGKETMVSGGRAVNEIQLGDDEYFVLGDNRNHSEDSRFEDVGNLKRDNIIGRAFIRIWPFNSFGLLKHK